MAGLITQEQAAKMLNIRPKTLSNWRRAGQGPRYSKVGRMVRYSEDAVNEFIAANERTTTMQVKP